MVDKYNRLQEFPLAEVAAYKQHYVYQNIKFLSSKSLRRMHLTLLYLS